MKIEIKTFRTKVARRIFILYILCAILPVAALATASFLMVRHQLQDQSQKRLLREAKGLALSIYERLMLLQAEMQIVRSNLDSYTANPGNHFPKALEAQLRERFTNLGVIRPQGGYEPLLGEVLKVPRFTQIGIQYLASGKALVSHEAGRGPFPRLFMFLGLGPEPRKQGILAAEIKRSSFWEIADGKPALSELCVLGADREILFSTSGISPTVAEKAFAQASRSPHAGSFDWRDKNQTYYACFWDLFLEANYFVPHWIVVLGEPEALVFKPMAGFKMYFPVILILTLGMVFLLSIKLIGKSMGPIETLKEGTKRVAEGEFGYQVQIETGDEFESLGADFNEMSQRLEETQNLIIRTAKMSTMGQMAAGVFHEVRQPLIAISGLVELSMRGDRSEKEKRHLKSAYLALKRLNAILENFKSFARTSEEKHEGIFIHMVLDQVVDLFQHQLKTKEIELRYERGKDMPPILGDEQGLQQVFSNLIMNAADALEEKGGKKRIIRIAMYEKTDNVIVEVEDNGTGIPEEIREQIFDPFFSTKDPEKGTGLGMPIIESILHRHNATIDLITEVGVGTKFTLAFPALATIPRRMVKWG